MSISSKENIIFFAQTICDCQYVSPPGSFFHECFCGTRTIVYLCVPFPSSIVTQKNCACTVLEEDHLSQLLKNGPDSRDYLFAIYESPTGDCQWSSTLRVYQEQSERWPLFDMPDAESITRHLIQGPDGIPYAASRAWMHSHSHTSGGVDTKGLPRTNGGPFPPIRHA